MTVAVKTRQYSEEEYLTLEREAPFKSEYWDGEIYPMAGAKKNHVRITVNLTVLLGNQVQDRNCEVFNSDMRVRVPGTPFYTYPAVCALCDEPRFYDGDTLENPQMVIEVLSRSTAGIDTDRKLKIYQTVPSLSDYLTASQDRIGITHYQRRHDLWRRDEYTFAADIIVLESIGFTLRVRDIYRNINF